MKNHILERLEGAGLLNTFKTIDSIKRDELLCLVSAKFLDAGKPRKELASQWLDISKFSESEIRNAIVGLIETGTKNIFAIWPSEKLAIEVDIEDFAKHHDDFWYPSSDDVWLTNARQTWLLMISHEEEITFISRL